ncbi:Glycosylphosphatidylinositol specific phospholipase D1 [Apophysomyces sp. BC1015]|nr:Glycosylphosphatidylinositol specific phospholipase D1 [Apophysomyces sp. BC1015]KAG0178943.1 Glycosylphosphatidylinositol specific phospholipase D1 [Apophysomyces sp. BC1021]
MATACGISVHNEVTHRSLELFPSQTSMQRMYKDMMTQSPGYVQAGSFFPDWGYQCLGYQQQSEDAHWAPFIKTAVHYIRETYPRPWQDPHVKGLVAFVFSIMSHDMADVKWHSLAGLRDYFIHAMAHMNFDGNIAKAHTAADTGAEFTLRHFSELAYLNETWQVPVRDMINIYRRLYDGTLIPIPSENDLKQCMTAGFLASKIDVKLGHIMFGYYGSKSPFLIEQLNDYHKGGLQDMSASVAECFSDLIGAFEHGYYPRGVLCTSYFDNESSSAEAKHCPVVDAARDYHQLAIEHGLILHETYDDTKGTLTLSMNASDTYAIEQEIEPLLPITHLFNSFNVQQQEQQQQQLVFQSSQSKISANQCRIVSRDSQSPAVVTLSLPVSSVAVGYATTTGDFNGDGQLDLAISAPYHSDEDDHKQGKRNIMAGTVFVVNGTNARLARRGRAASGDIRTESAVILKGKDAHGRFGWSTATVDFNQDGVDDLAVASPFSHNYTGHIDVFFGHRGLEGLSAKADVRIKLQPSAGPVEGFGLHLSGLDIDNDGYKDLVVGCPYCSVRNHVQAGSLHVFKSRPNPPQKLSKSDWVLVSQDVMSYEHFGGAIEFVPSEEDCGTLVVGAPGTKISGQQQVGRVYGFQIQPLLPARLAWSLTGSKKFQQFGSVIAAGKSGKTKGLLAISSPSEDTYSILEKHWQAGVVRVYDWDALRADGLEWGLERGLLRQMSGREIAGHLGASVAFFEQEGHPGLWIGEPMADKERGRVFRWSFDDDDVQCIKDGPMHDLGLRSDL